jgi:hypothetical protein
MATDADKEAEKMMKSTAIMEESYDLVNQQRFGLFSQPGSLALGENNYGKKKMPTRDEDGRVQTEPPNFLTTKTKKGATDAVLFSIPSYVSQGDPFTDNKLKMREGKKDGYKAVADLPFKPTKTVSKIVKKEHDWIPEDDNKKKNFRDAEGAVITAPRNFTTIGAKKGNPATTPGVLFTKEPYPHMTDEYDRKKEIATKEHKESQKKMQEKPFSQRIKQTGAFNSIEEAYGEEGLTFKAKKPPAKDLPQVEHDKPFKPSNPAKKGVLEKTLAGFPEYIEEKPEPKKRQPKKDDERPSWKPNTFKKTIPSPSVACNMKNIRSSLPSMMRR